MGRARGEIGRAYGIRPEFTAAAAEAARTPEREAPFSPPPRTENTAFTARESAPQAQQLSDVADRAVGGLFDSMARGWWQF
jgi:hypothetical protein